MKFKSIFTNFIIIAITTSYLAACSLSPKVQTVQVGDYDLTKQELLTELKKLDTAEKQINNNRGVNGTNIAAALFWLPGLAVTMLDSYEASKLVHERRAHITNLYNQKLKEEKVTKVAAKSAKTNKG